MFAIIFLFITLVFFNCSNPRHIKYIDLLSEYTTVSTVPTPFILYHDPVRFSLSGVFIHNASVPSSLLRLVVPPEYITWLLFDYVIHSFGSQLTSWPGGIVKHYMLEISIFYYCVTPYMLSDTFIRFTTLFYFYYLLRQLHHSHANIFTLNSRIEPCTYRVLFF